MLTMGLIKALWDQWEYFLWLQWAFDKIPNYPVESQPLKDGPDVSIPMGTVLERIWLHTRVTHSISRWSRCKCGISIQYFVKYHSGDKGSIFWLTASILAGTWNSLQPHQDLAGSQTPFTIMGHHTNINGAVSKPAVIINFTSFKRKRGFQPFERIFQMNNYTVWWCLISVYLWMLLKL